MLPADAFLAAPIKRYPASIMINSAGRWESISSPRPSSQPVAVRASECDILSGIVWQAGHYDVVFKAISDNGTRRYAARFTLARDKGGNNIVLEKRITITNSEAR